MRDLYIEIKQVVQDVIQDFIKSENIKDQEYSEKLKSDIPNIISSRVQELPKISAIAKILKNIHDPDISPKRLYQGKIKDGDPIEFLNKHYQKELEEKTLYAAKLSKIDLKLYRCISKVVNTHNEKNPNDKISMQNFLPTKEDHLENRKKTFCELLDIERDKLFSTLQTARDR